MKNLLEFRKIGSIFVVELDIYKENNTNNFYIMVYLKEDGSLDVERIYTLSLEESWNAMRSMTQKQKNEYVEYVSKLPINESKGPVKVVKVDYSVADMLARGCATAEQVSEYLRKKCE